MFKMKLIEVMPRMSLDQLQLIIMKIDNIQRDVIYWEDFLKFMENEGELREMINDLRINQAGTARIKELRKFKIKKATVGNSQGTEEEAKASLRFQSHQVEKMLFIIVQDDFEYILCTSDKQDVELLDFQSLMAVYQFNFESKYAKPRPKSKQPNPQTFSIKFEAESSNEDISVDSSRQLS